MVDIMAKGLPKKYAKMGFKKGWKAYKASKKGSRRKASRNTPKYRSTRRRGGRRGMNGIAVLAGAIGSAGAAIGNYGSYKESGLDSGQALVATFTGYQANRDNDMKSVGIRLLRTYGPVATGIAVHKGASYFGVNRSLPKGVNL